MQYVFHEYQKILVCKVFLNIFNICVQLHIFKGTPQCFTNDMRFYLIRQWQDR